MEFNEAYLTLAGTVFGGAGLKIIEQILGKGKRREDIATSLRKELREELQELRTDNDKLEASVDEWRTKYYRLVARMAANGMDIEE
jgi:hypothetical protein